MSTANPDPTRAEIDQLPGPLLLEFGTGWCGHCRAIQPALHTLLSEFPQVQHIVIEDGPGQPLGRSFRVKLWPSLVFMRAGQVVQQMARPNSQEMRAGFEAVLR